MCTSFVLILTLLYLTTWFYHAMSVNSWSVLAGFSIRSMITSPIIKNKHVVIVVYLIGVFFSQVNLYSYNVACLLIPYVFSASAINNLLWLMNTKVQEGSASFFLLPTGDQPKFRDSFHWGLSVFIGTWKEKFGKMHMITYRSPYRWRW